MLTCPALPDRLYRCSVKVLAEGGTVVLSGREVPAFKAVLHQLGVDPASAPRSRSRGEDGGLLVVFDALEGSVAVFTEFVDFPNDCPLSYQLRLQFSPGRGWNGGRVPAHGARRFFAPVDGA